MWVFISLLQLKGSLAATAFRKTLPRSSPTICGLTSPFLPLYQPFKQTRALCTTNGVEGKPWKPSDHTVLEDLSSRIRQTQSSSLKDHCNRNDFNELPVYNPLANNKRAVVVSSEPESKKAVQAIRTELNKSRMAKKGGADPTCKALQFVGFDMEGANLGKKGIPALIQIATPSTVYLFRIRHECSASGNIVGEAWTPDLGHLLSDSNIAKVGVGVNNDILCLRSTYGDNVCGDGGSYLDLAELVKIKWPRVKRFGLRNLTATVLCQRLCKAPRNRDWHRKELTDTMTKYAAADAFVSLDLLDAILSNTKGPTPEDVAEANQYKYTLILTMPPTYLEKFVSSLRSELGKDAKNEGGKAKLKKTKGAKPEVNQFKYTLTLTMPQTKVDKFVSSLRSRLGKKAINQGGRAKIKEVKEAKPKATAETKQVKYTLTLTWQNWKS